MHVTHTLENCNNILSFNKYIETYPFYENISIIDSIMNVKHKNIENMHSSMGLSWKLYGECKTNTYTLSFKARLINTSSLDSQFKIYVGETDKDWIIIDDVLENEWKEFRLTTTFYFTENNNGYNDIIDGFRIGFVNPIANMEYCIKDLQFVLGTNIIPNIIYDNRIYYIERPILDKTNINIITHNVIYNYIKNYIIKKNILMQPYEFIITDEIKNTDIFIVFEPPPEQKPNDEYLKIMINNITKLTQLFKFNVIYYYELPSGYSHHFWKLNVNFLNKFNMVFSQIAKIVDNKKYIWIPCNTFINNYTCVEPINFNKKKLLCNCPISSGYNYRRIDYMNNIAKYYDIDVYGMAFEPNNFGSRCNQIKEKYKQFISKDEIGDRGLYKVNIFKKYKYVFVFENCYEYGYISERIFDVLAAGSIPIYYGNNINFLFENTEGIINGHSFTDIHNLYNYINSITEEKYNNMVNTNLKFIEKYIINFQWNKIWHFVFDKILKNNGSNEILEKTNTNLYSKNILDLRIVKLLNVSLENSEGKIKIYEILYNE